MTIDQIIALSASVGGCLSAIATFLTIRQMSQQREATYLPELVLSRTLFVGSKDPILAGAMPTLWVPKTDTDGTAEVSRTFSMPLSNVGLGAAKGISVAWSFPIKEMVSQVNDLAQRTLTPAYLELKDGDLSIKSESLGSAISRWANQQHDSLDYVLPAAVQKEPVVLALPHAFVLLSSALLFVSAKDKDRKSIADMPRLMARFEYRDIGDRHHVAVFEIKLQIIALGGEGTFIQGYLESKKCA
jgi:hypothetical protein